MHQRRRTEVPAGGVVLRGAVAAVAFAFGCALAGSSASAGSASPLSNAQRVAIGSVATSALQRYQTPAVSIALVRNGRLVYAAGFGTRDRGHRLAADARTRYGIGSLTKSLVAALILRLAEQGRLSLHDRVTRWLPEYSNARNVEIAELLHQTSGIRDYNDALFLLTVAPDVIPGHVNRTAVVGALERWPLRARPGSTFDYSNANYLLLGIVAERATGVWLGELLRRELFAPLGMRDTDLGRPTGTNEAVGFTKSPLGPVAVAPWDPALTYSAGGVRSSAIDIARFDAALCEGRVVSPRSFAAMLAPARLSNGTFSEYGAGYFVYESARGPVAWHDGTVMGYKAMHLVVPAGCDAVVVLSNADYFHAQVVAQQIAQIALGIRGGEREGFDANLPRASMLLGAALALLPLAAFALRRRHGVIAVLTAFAAYASGVVWLPAGLVFAVIGGALVTLLPTSGSRPVAARTSLPG